jgi:RNA polymerase sigma-70 factor (ECF subfamily)
MPDRQEQTIISLILDDGDSEQYSLLVERYHRGLVQHLNSLTSNMQMAEDIAQEAFIRAYHKLSQYNQAYAFSTWLYKIADNIAYRQLSQLKTTSDISDVEELIADDQPSPADLVDIQLTSDKVQLAISKLPLEYKQAISLYYWENFSYEEIAEIMQRPIGTIRTWLYRAKEILRKDLYGQV